MTPERRTRQSKWYVDLGEAPLLFALGIHVQYLFVDRRNQLGIVMMSSQADPLDAERHCLNRRPRRLLDGLRSSEDGVSGQQPGRDLANEADCTGSFLPAPASEG